MNIDRGTEHELIDLRTSSALLLVTSTHRVWAKRHNGPPQSVRASLLRIGDIVFTGRNYAEEVLLHVTPFRGVVDIADISFARDKVVEAVHPVGILSKGNEPRTRRGYGNKRKIDLQVLWFRSSDGLGLSNHFAHSVRLGAFNVGARPQSDVLHQKQQSVHFFVVHTS